VKVGEVRLRRWCGQVEVVTDIHCYGVGATCSGTEMFLRSLLYFITKAISLMCSLDLLLLSSLDHSLFNGLFPLHGPIDYRRWGVVQKSNGNIHSKSLIFNVKSKILKIFVKRCDFLNTQL